MNILSFILLVILGVYLFMIVCFRQRWNRYDVFKPGDGNATVAVSLVIAFRNELSTLGTLLLYIDKQVLARELFEVVLVNDGSDDGSERIAREYADKRANVIFIDNPEGIPGKKQALASGIEAAANEVIVVTDADCILGSQWLQTISGYFTLHDPDLIIGLVDIEQGATLLTRFQEMEFLSLVASGAGAAACNIPVYCNGACLVFKKGFYKRCADPLKGITASGDDTFLLHAAKKEGKSIKLLKSVDATVTTRGLPGWREFINQRLRWVSKGRYYSDKDTLFVAAIVLLMNMAWLFSLLLLLTGHNGWTFAALFAGKAVADYLLLHSFYGFYGKTFPVVYFLLFSLLYPFYATMVAPGGLFFGYQWKGRRYRPGGA